MRYMGTETEYGIMCEDTTISPIVTSTHAVVAYAALHTLLWALLSVRRGARLNPLLGATAALMLAYALGFVVVAVAVSC